MVGYRTRVFVETLAWLEVTHDERQRLEYSSKKKPFDSHNFVLRAATQTVKCTEFGSGRHVGNTTNLEFLGQIVTKNLCI
jgi:hypothetical protein